MASHPVPVTQVICVFVQSQVRSCLASIWFRVHHNDDSNNTVKVCISIPQVWDRSGLVWVGPTTMNVNACQTITSLA
jgi:hypothetical protein